MPKEETQYKKGHKGYFHGKKVDEDLFFALLDLYFLGRISMNTACKIIGLSRPTLTKRWNHVLTRKEIPWEDWFYGYDKEKGERKRAYIRKQIRAEQRKKDGK